MKKNIIFIDLALLILALDQLTKWFVIEHMIKPITNLSTTPLFTWMWQSGEQIPYQHIPFTPFFNIVMVWNKGISFGLFNDATHGPIVLTLISSIIAIVFLIWLLRTDSITHMIACALIIGGAVGNIMDRIRFEAVIDFLDFHAYGYHFPAFNVADSAICIGISMIVIHSLFFEDKTV